MASGATASDVSEAPVQAQIAYTHADGSRRVRVLSALRAVVRERGAAEAAVNVAVVAVAAMQRCVTLRGFPKNTSW